MVHLDASLAKEETLVTRAQIRALASSRRWCRCGVDGARLQPGCDPRVRRHRHQGVQAPIIAILAFIPMLCVSYAYKELNNAIRLRHDLHLDTRAFGPKSGGSAVGIVAADILVMASLPRSRQYVFLLFGTSSIVAIFQHLVLLVGIAWIVVMTAICYVGVEISANLQKVLLASSGRLGALLHRRLRQDRNRQGAGRAPHAKRTVVQSVPQSGLHQLHDRFSLMLFIYWAGTRRLGQRGNQGLDPHAGACGRYLDAHPPGTYAIVIVASQSYAGVGSTGSGSPTRPTRATSSIRWRLGLRHLGVGRSWSSCCVDGAHLGGGLDTDHDFADAAPRSPWRPTRRSRAHSQGAQALPHAHHVNSGHGGVSIALYVAMNYLSNGAAS